MRTPCLQRALALGLCATAAAGTLLFEVDGGLAELYSAKPRFISLPALRAEEMNTHIYVINGVTADAALSIQISKLSQRYGQVHTIEYARRFDAKAATAFINRHIQQLRPQRLVLIGLSMGGRLVGSLLETYQHGLPPTAVILNDAPFTGKDIIPSYTWVSDLWQPGPIANWLLTKPFWQLVAPGITRNTQDPAYDESQRQKAFSVGRNFPLSCYAGQIRFMRHSRPIPTKQFAHIPAVYVHAKQDAVIRAESQQRWSEAFGGFVDTQLVDAGHADYLGEPTKFNQAFDRALGTVLAHVPI